MFTIHTSPGGHDVFSLPVRISADEIAGLIQAVARRGRQGTASLSSLRRAFQSDDDRLLATVKVAEVLGFAAESNGELNLTPLGRELVHASSRERKRIFGGQLRRALPWVKDIQSDVIGDHRNKLSLDDLSAKLTEFHQDVNFEKGVLQVIEWARYAGLFEYNDRTRQISLRTEQVAPAHQN